MDQLFSKRREISIRDLKQRREEIFEKTRMLMMADSPNESFFQQETENAMSMEEPMEQELSEIQRGRNKKKEMNNRICRYYRKMLQVNDWMLSVPDNLSEFYVAARPDGYKCLVIFRGYRMQLRDKAGNLILKCEIKSKTYDNSIFEAYFNKQRQLLLFSDLIIWKGNPMTSSEFEFRCSWLISNLRLTNLSGLTGLSMLLLNYQKCNLEGLKNAYNNGNFLYERDGLLFVHKDSFYLHGLNPNVLVWKDLNISKYLHTEIEESKGGCKGIGFLNKDGEIKSIENVTLFTIDRKTKDPTHRFVRFGYTNMAIENLQDDQVRVYFENLVIFETVRNYNGPYDSLGKLLYKCKVKESIVNIEQIAKKCNYTAMESS